MEAAAMRFSDKARLTEEVAGGLSQATELLTGAFIALLVRPPSDDGDDSLPPGESARLRATIWRLRQLLHEAMGDGTDHELVDLLNSLVQRSDQIERAVVAWVDLIEVLVQHTERRYGSQPGRGRIKSAEVKQVVRFLLNTDRSARQATTIVGVFEPIVMDIIVTWIVDGMVLAANRYGFWEDADPAPQSLMARLGLAWHWVLRLFEPLAVRLALLVRDIWLSFQRRVPLSPAVRSALKAVQAEGTLINREQFFAGATNTIVWIGTHRKQLIASLELVFAVVHEAESFGSLTGPQKKIYARDLVLAVLDEAGLNLSNPLIFAIVDALVRGAIEATVNIFNKRGVFPQS
jgi:hypothetical protein